jgi:hypothetical protein
MTQDAVNANPLQPQRYSHIQGHVQTERLVLNAAVLSNVTTQQLKQHLHHAI